MHLEAISSDGLQDQQSLAVRLNLWVASPDLWRRQQVVKRGTFRPAAAAALNPSQGLLFGSTTAFKAAMRCCTWDPALLGAALKPTTVPIDSPTSVFWEHIEKLRTKTKSALFHFFQWRLANFSAEEASLFAAPNESNSSAASGNASASNSSGHLALNIEDKKVEGTSKKVSFYLGAGVWCVLWIWFVWICLMLVFISSKQWVLDGKVHHLFRYRAFLRPTRYHPEWLGGRETLRLELWMIWC